MNNIYASTSSAEKNKDRYKKKVEFMFKYWYEIVRKCELNCYILLGVHNRILIYNRDKNNRMCSLKIITNINNNYYHYQ